MWLGSAQTSASAMSSATRSWSTGPTNSTRSRSSTDIDDRSCSVNDTPVARSTWSRPTTVNRAVGTAATTAGKPSTSWRTPFFSHTVPRNSTRPASTEPSRGWKTSTSTALGITVMARSPRWSSSAVRFPMYALTATRSSARPIERASIQLRTRAGGRPSAAAKNRWPPWIRTIAGNPSRRGAAHNEGSAPSTTSIGSRSWTCPSRRHSRRWSRTARNPGTRPALVNRITCTPRSSSTRSSGPGPCDG